MNIIPYIYKLLGLNNLIFAGLFVALNGLEVPSLLLLMIALTVFVIDWITGFAKGYVQKEVSSGKMKQVLIKLGLYLFVILLSIIAIPILNGGIGFVMVIDLANNGYVLPNIATCLIIVVEVISIIENFIILAPNNLLVNKLLVPLAKLLNLQVINKLEDIFENE